MAKAFRSRSISVDRKAQNAPEIDVLKSHWGDVPKNLAVDLAAVRAPTFERRLHSLGIPSRDNIGHHGQPAELRDKIFISPAAL